MIKALIDIANSDNSLRPYQIDSKQERYNDRCKVRIHTYRSRKRPLWSAKLKIIHLIDKLCDRCRGVVCLQCGKVHHRETILEHLLTSYILKICSDHLQCPSHRLRIRRIPVFCKIIHIYQNFNLESTIMVTGPSFSRDTFISAPKIPHLTSLPDCSSTKDTNFS